MTDRTSTRFLSLLFVSLFLGSCTGLSREYPQIRLYTLDPVRSAPPSSAQGDGVLLVKAFTASSTSVGTNFLLRRGGGRVEKDYYNRFIVVPPDLAQDNASAWLRESALFADVRQGSSNEAADWELTGHVVSMEGDFSGEPSAAVMELQFVLEPGRNAAGERFFGTYAERIDLESSSPSALIAGWDAAFAAILTRLESDLAAHPRE